MMNVSRETVTVTLGATSSRSPKSGPGATLISVPKTGYYLN